MKTTDLGLTWTRVGSPLQDVTVLAADPVSPQVLFAAGSGQVFKSTDSGATWRVVYAAASSLQPIAALVIDPGNHLRLAAVDPSTGAFLRSLDNGETWTSWMRLPILQQPAIRRSYGVGSAVSDFGSPVLDESSSCVTAARP